MECIVHIQIKFAKGDSTYICIELHTYISNEHQNKYVLLKIVSKSIQNFTIKKHTYVTGFDNTGFRA